MTDKQKGKYIPAIRQLEPADERVAEILDDRQQHFDELRLSPPERKRLLEARQKKEARKKQEKEKMQRRSRATLDMPSVLQESIAAMAGKEGVTFSQVVTFLLFDAIERYERQEITFWGHKHPSGSPRYDWNLVHPKDTERQENLQSRKNEKSGWGT